MPRPAKPAAKPKRKSPPFPFLLEALDPLHPQVRPMFGGHAIYIGDKIVAMLRDSLKSPEDNGLWLVFSESAFSETAAPASPALRQEFPSLRPIQLLGGKIAHWELIPSDHPNFETESLHACDLILRHDTRIGRIPKSRQKSNKPSRPRS